MALRKILVGIDFSESSDIAARRALQLARRHAAELVLLHVANIPADDSDVPLDLEPGAEHEPHVQEHLKEVRTRIEVIRDSFVGLGAEVSLAVVGGFPDEVIPRVSSGSDVDLTVVGSHGRTGLRRVLMGSTAERVVRLTPGNVMVARCAEGDSSKADGYGSVLVPIDFSGNEREMVATAVELGAEEARIELLHLWQLPGAVYMKGKAGLEWAAQLRKRLSQGSETKLRTLAEEMSQMYNRTIINTIREADARFGIQQRLGETEFDLVVVGSHGRRGFKRWALGSVAEATVRHAPCSVVVFHRATGGGH